MKPRDDFLRRSLNSRLNFQTFSWWMKKVFRFYVEWRKVFFSIRRKSNCFFFFHALSIIFFLFVISTVFRSIVSLLLIFIKEELIARILSRKCRKLQFHGSLQSAMRVNKSNLRNEWRHKLGNCNFPIAANRSSRGTHLVERQRPFQLLDDDARWEDEKSQ